MDWITRKEIFQFECKSKPATPTLSRQHGPSKAVIDCSSNFDKDIPALKDELKDILAKKEERSGMYSAAVPVFI
jgi:hypothetical protein